jgi:diaminohydroxyphosphoribosylaminopyrimidine deaminase / 5-amino-6-(5-phosphoribosylamino)uracil reductase
MSERWNELMRQALELAERGRYGASPNPMVGAVVLSRDGQVVGQGAHLRCGGPHAEVVALEEAGEQALGGTLIVTLEPCAHQGRTPPCTDAVVRSGVARVVIAARDPNPLVNGKGVAALVGAGVEVVEGVEESASRALNRRFIHWVTTERPFVTLKMAISLDGKLAARGGRSRWITSEAARHEGYALREEYDALLVGVGTVSADDPRLCRHLGLNPDSRLLRAILDSHLRMSESAAVLAQDGPGPVVFCTEHAPADRARALRSAGAEVVEVGEDEQGRCELRQVLRWLGSHGVSSLLVEGGGEVHWSFLREALAQRVHAFLAPLVLGGKEATPAVGGLGFASPQEAVHLRFVEVRRVASDLVIVAEVEGV